MVRSLAERGISAAAVLRGDGVLPFLSARERTMERDIPMGLWHYGLAPVLRK
jgi:hypothetical protein